MAVRDMSRFGKKWSCYSCGTKFYDLNRDAPLCPRCGADQSDAPPAEDPIPASRVRVEVEVPEKVADEDDEDVDGFDDLDDDAADDLIPIDEDIDADDDDGDADEETDEDMF
jgi:hypothetical protein